MSSLKKNELENEDEDEEDLEKRLIISDEQNFKSNKSSYNSIIWQELSIEIMSDQSTNYDKSIKVILLGDSNVGKSSILNCLQQDSSLQRKTLSLEHYNYVIKLNNFVLRMQIWDTVGQEKFDSITTNYYKTTDVAILVYAINDLNSFNNINHWYNQLIDKEKKNNDDINKVMIKVLIGNKSDLADERKITYEQGEKLCKEKKFNFFEEINCKFYKEGVFDENSFENKNENKNDDTNENNSCENNCVQNLFDKIGKIIYMHYMNESKSRHNSTFYNYEASETMLEANEEKEEDEKKCCC